jgi:hypothetical protein
LDGVIRIEELIYMYAALEYLVWKLNRPLFHSIGGP